MLPAQKKIDLAKRDLSDATKEALAGLYLENISIPEELLSDIYLFDAGLITKEVFLERAFNRAKN